MWWHADLPAADGPAQPGDTPSGHADRGEFLLEWMLPGVTPEPPHAIAGDGDQRRCLRRQTHEDDA